MEKHSATQKTNTPPERSSALVKAMRKHISKLLRKIKEVAPLAGLNYRNYQDEQDIKNKYQLI